MRAPIFNEIISRHGVQPDPYTLQTLANLSLPTNKKGLQSFLGIMNYLGKFSPVTAVYKPVERLISAKADGS